MFIQSIQWRWMQAGGINSVGALHDARSKQVPLNPLRTRKSAVGQAANPVIRQHSIAHQTQAKRSRQFAGLQTFAEVAVQKCAKTVGKLYNNSSFTDGGHWRMIGPSTLICNHGEADGIDVFFKRGHKNGC